MALNVSYVDDQKLNLFLGPGEMACSAFKGADEEVNPSFIQKV